MEATAYAHAPVVSTPAGPPVPPQPPLPDPPGKHAILEAAYFVEAPDVNRSYVVGSTAAGVEVSGSAITPADVDLVGERLSAHHNPAVPTAIVAAAVAIAPLSMSRLDSPRARVAIAPHCGVVLWDVVSVTDDIANQAAYYRVTGYTLEFRAGLYRPHP
jgi:hypothetical protein